MRYNIIIFLIHDSIRMSRAVQHRINGNPTVNRRNAQPPPRQVYQQPPPPQPVYQQPPPSHYSYQPQPPPTQLQSSLTIPQVISMMTVRISDMEMWQKQHETIQPADGSLSQTELTAILDRIQVLEEKAHSTDRMMTTMNAGITNKIKKTESLYQLLGQRLDMLESCIHDPADGEDTNGAQLDEMGEEEEKVEEYKEELDDVS